MPAHLSFLVLRPRGYRADIGVMAWTASLTARRRRSKAKEDIEFLGLSLVTGGTPTFEARIISAWRAFHANRAHLTSHSLSR